MAFSFGDFPIHDRIVLVTGGGSGIGLSFVKLAHNLGAKVLIADLRLHGDAAKLGITSTTPRIVFQECDVTKWDQLQNLLTVSSKEFGDVPDVYVASAGIIETSFSNFWSDVETSSYKIIEINVNHPIKLTRLAIRACLGKDKRGVVLLVASIAGYTGIYGAPLYSSSKHAVIGFTKSMLDTAKYQGVKVVTVCPAAVSTPLWTENPSAADQFSITPALSIAASTVASSMLSLITSSAHESGTVLEVSVLGERIIPPWNVDPPGMVDGKMAAGTGIPQEALERSVQPVLEITGKERGVHKF